MTVISVLPPSSSWNLWFSRSIRGRGDTRSSQLPKSCRDQVSGPSFPRVRTLELSLECAQDGHLVSNILSEDDDVKTGNAGDIAA